MLKHFLICSADVLRYSLSFDPLPTDNISRHHLSKTNVTLRCGLTDASHIFCGLPLASLTRPLLTHSTSSLQRSACAARHPPAQRMCFALVHSLDPSDRRYSDGNTPLRPTALCVDKGLCTDTFSHCGCTFPLDKSGTQLNYYPPTSLPVDLYRSTASFLEMITSTPLGSCNDLVSWMLLM